MATSGEISWPLTVSSSPTCACMNSPLAPVHILSVVPLSLPSREQVVVGQNRFTETEASPLTADAEGGVLVLDDALEQEEEPARRQHAQRMAHRLADHSR